MPRAVVSPPRRRVPKTQSESRTAREGRGAQHAGLRPLITQSEVHALTHAFESNTVRKPATSRSRVSSKMPTPAKSYKPGGYGNVTPQLCFKDAKCGDAIDKYAVRAVLPEHRASTAVREQGVLRE